MKPESHSSLYRDVWIMTTTTHSTGTVAYEYHHHQAYDDPESDKLLFSRDPTVEEWKAKLLKSLSENTAATQFVYTVLFPGNRTQRICPSHDIIAELSLERFIDDLVSNLADTLKYVYMATNDHQYNELTTEADNARLITSTFTLIQAPRVVTTYGTVGSGGHCKYTIRDNFKCISYGNKDLNCFPMLLRKALNLNQQCRTIRKNLCLKQNTKIELNDDVLLSVAIVYKVECEIYKLEDDKLVKQRAAPALTPDDKILKILVIDDHVEHILCSLKPDDWRSDQNDVIIGYDFETVYGKDGIMKPYLVQWVVYRADGRIISPAQCYFSPTFEAYTQMVAVLIHVASQYNDVTLMGYNNSRFDDLILLPELLKHFQVSTFFAGNTLLQMKLGRLPPKSGEANKDQNGGAKSFRIQTFDLCKHLMMSLRTACFAFKCNQQKETISHDDIQRAYVQGIFPEYYDKHRKVIESYGLADVTSMMELYFKYAAETEKLLQPLFAETEGKAYRKSIKDFQTISQLAEHIHTETIGSGAGKRFDLKRFDLEQQKEFRKCVTAGRSDVFKLGVSPEPVTTVDVVSQYPTSMAKEQYVEECDAEMVSEFTTKGIGLYKVRIKSQPPFSVVPFCSEKGYDWHYKGEFITHLLTPTLQALRENEGACEVICGLVWPKLAFGVYKAYVDKLYKMKQLQDEYKGKSDSAYNPALRTVVKLLLNGLSGKQIQRSFTRDTRLLRTPADLKTMLEDCKDVTYTDMNGVLIASGQLYEPATSKHTHLNGALIYEYSRAGMCKNVYSKVPIEALIYTETDSACMLRSAYEVFAKGNKQICQDRVVHNLGELSDETEEMLEEFAGRLKLTDMPAKMKTQVSPIRCTEKCMQAYMDGEYRDTKYNGPYIVVCGKKCHCYYMINIETNEKIVLKMKFKGLNTVCQSRCDSTKCPHVTQVITSGMYEQMKYCKLDPWKLFNIKNGLAGEESDEPNLVDGVIVIHNTLTDKYVPLADMMEPFQLKHYFQFLEKGCLYVLTDQIQRIVNSQGVGAGIKKAFTIKHLRMDSSMGVYTDEEIVQRHRSIEPIKLKQDKTKFENGIPVSTEINLDVMKRTRAESAIIQDQPKMKRTVNLLADNDIAGAAHILAKKMDDTMRAGLRMYFKGCNLLPLEAKEYVKHCRSIGKCVSISSWLQSNRPKLSLEERAAWVASRRGVMVLLSDTEMEALVQDALAPEP